MLSVRQYQSQDFPRLLEIDQSCFVEGIAYSKEEMRYFVGMPTAICFVGLQDEEIIGFIIADRFRPRRASRSVGKIITIDVVPQAQHSGFGTLLMSAAEAELKKAGCDYVSLEVAVDNEPALQVLQEAWLLGAESPAALLSGLNRRAADGEEAVRRVAPFQ